MCSALCILKQYAKQTKLELSLMDAVALRGARQTTSVRDPDHLSNRLGILNGAKHEVGDIRSGDRQPPPEVLPECDSVTAALRSVRESWRSNDRPLCVALAKNVFHPRQIGVVSAKGHFGQRREQITHEEPVTGIVLRRIRTAR